MLFFGGCQPVECLARGAGFPGRGSRCRGQHGSSPGCSIPDSDESGLGIRGCESFTIRSPGPPLCFSESPCWQAGDRRSASACTHRDAPRPSRIRCRDREYKWTRSLGQSQTANSCCPLASPGDRIPGTGWPPLRAPGLCTSRGMPAEQGEDEVGWTGECTEGPRRIPVAESRCVGTLSGQRVLRASAAHPSPGNLEQRTTGARV